MTESQLFSKCFKKYLSFLIRKFLKTLCWDKLGLWHFCLDFSKKAWNIEKIWNKKFRFICLQIMIPYAHHHNSWVVSFLLILHFLRKPSTNENNGKHLSWSIQLFCLKYFGYCGLCCKAVCITRNFSEDQNLLFVIESGVKSRAGYNVLTVNGN